jgi:antitoxin component YwqK of YwqJK toxin-antitoxin module
MKRFAKKDGKFNLINNLYHEIQVESDTSYLVSKYKDTTVVDKWIRIALPHGNYFKINDLYWDNRELKKICTSKTIFPLQILDSVSTYYKNGQLKGISYYKNLNNYRWRHWDENGQEGVENVYIICEEMASFPGGEAELFKFLRENIKYPKRARRKGNYGRWYS